MHTSQTQLKKPSEALALAFELPDAEESDNLNSVNSQAVSTAYGIPLSDFGLLLPVTSNNRVLDSYHLCPLPNTQSWLLGMVNVNGVIAPVFDLYHLLGIEKGKKENQRLMMIGTGTDAVGFLFFTYPRQVNFDQLILNETLPPLPTRLKETVTQCYRSDIFWLTWNYQKFFSELIVAEH